MSIDVDTGPTSDRNTEYWPTSTSAGWRTWHTLIGNSLSVESSKRRAQDIDAGNDARQLNGDADAGQFVNNVL